MCRLNLICGTRQGENNFFRVFRGWEWYIKHAIFLAAFGLKCKVCSSQESMDKCDANVKDEECPASMDRCAKVSLVFKVAIFETKSFSKGCSTKALCEAGNDVYKSCKNVEGSTCQLDCCDEDLCNTGATPVISVFLMMACVVLALFR